MQAHAHAHPSFTSPSENKEIREFYLHVMSDSMSLLIANRLIGKKMVTVPVNGAAHYHLNYYQNIKKIPM